MEAITQEFIKELFELREDGFLYWKAKRNGCKIGQKAGCMLVKRGRLTHVIVVNKTHYPAAKIKFVYHYGYMPEIVDHIDNNQLNDSIENLRAATRLQNGRNRSKSKNSASKYLGVFRKHNKWAAEIRPNKERKFLGYFPTQEDAALAYNKQALIEYKEFANLNIITSESI